MIDFLTVALNEKKDPDVKLELLGGIINQKVLLSNPSQDLTETILRTAISSSGSLRLRIKALNAYKDIPAFQPQLIKADHVLKINRIAFDFENDVNLRFVALRTLHAIATNCSHLINQDTLDYTQHLATNNDEDYTLRKLAQLNLSTILNNNRIKHNSPSLSLS